MIDITPWTTPVTLLIGASRYIVRNATEAAWLLADKWPELGGRAFMRALAACAAASEGKRSAAYARLAFISAAREANLALER